MKRSFHFSLLCLLFVLTILSCKKSKTDEESNIERDIKLTLTFTTSADAVVPATFADMVKRVQELLTKVFSSKDFKDELYKRNFHDSAYSKSIATCFNRIYGGTVKGRSIAGEAVYDNLLPNTAFSIAVTIRNNGTNTTTLGSASACGSRITTNDYWLKLSEKRLAHRLARHWAHEYTHIKGYRHDTNVAAGYEWGSDVNKDPAYGVGDVVGVVLEKWLAEGVIK